MQTKRLFFSTRWGRRGFNGQAMTALGVCQLLATAGRQGLTVAEIVDGLATHGMLMSGNDERQILSVLLQRLIKVGAVDHPTGPGQSRRYILTNWPEIQVA